MSAIHFLNKNPLSLKIKFPEVEIAHSVSKRMNYMIINYITSDLVQELQDLVDHKIIIGNPFHKKLLELSDCDAENLLNDYKNHNMGKAFSLDYFHNVEYFQKLAAKQLSDYQKSNDRFLEKLLYAILCLDYILVIAPFISIDFPGKRSEVLMESLRLERKILVKVFDRRFSKVSNFRFTHNQYAGLLEKIKHSDPRGFAELKKNI